ncbi:MAG: response regulator [Planctomycetota bacterium]
MVDGAGRFADRRVLLVDNDRDVSDLVATFLRRHGLETSRAESGKAGLDSLCSAARPFDLVILDLRMPLMGGLEFLGHAERLLGDRCPPVLVVSGFVTACDREILRQSQRVHAVLDKPFDLEELLSRVRDALAMPWSGPETR